jgi:5-methylcytosine-specific restriction endonuclease McrA
MKRKGTKLAERQREYGNGGTCAKCQLHYPKLTVEHIVPGHILGDLGLADLIYDDDENMEPLCFGCNALKGPKLDPLHPKTHALLARYVLMSRDKYAQLHAAPRLELTTTQHAHQLQ